MTAMWWRGKCIWMNHFWRRGKATCCFWCLQMHTFSGCWCPLLEQLVKFSEFKCWEFGSSEQVSTSFNETTLHKTTKDSSGSWMKEWRPHLKNLCADSKCHTPGNSKVEELEMKNKKLAEELEMHCEAFEGCGGEMSELMDDFNDLKHKMWDLEDQSRRQNKTMSQLAQLNGMSGVPRSNLAVPIFSEITETSVCSFCCEVTEEGKGRMVCECEFRCHCSPECKRLHWIGRHKNECHLLSCHCDPFSKMHDPEKWWIVQQKKWQHIGGRRRCQQWTCEQFDRGRWRNIERWQGLWWLVSVALCCGCWGSKCFRCSKKCLKFRRVCEAMKFWGG